MTDAVRVKLCANCPTTLFMLATTWCGPCKAFAPVRDELLAQDNVYNGELNTKIHYKVFEHGTDDEVQKSFGVKGYPTILVFSPNTQKFVKYEGSRTADAISRFADSYHNGTMETPVSLWQTTPKMMVM